MTSPLRVVAALLVLLGASLARADFSFIHTSDTHINPKTGPGSNAETNSLLYDEISTLTPLPAFVVNTGDVCEYGTDEEYKVYRQTLEHLKIPRNDAPGNHDVRWNPRGKQGYTLGVGQPLYRSWDHENVHFVTLDSTVLLQHWGHISQDQLDWLKADLEKVGPDKPVVIGFHHWVGRSEGQVQVDNEQKLLELVAPYNVRLWLQGHGHSDIQWNVNGVPAIMQKGLYQGSYSVIDVTADTMKVRRRTIGKPDPSNELIRDKSVPTAPDAVWTDVMTIPLAKPVAPKWAAEAKVDGRNVVVTAQRGDLPDDAKVDFRIDGGKYKPMDGTGDAWSMQVPLKGLTAGEHVVTVQATLADGRAYQKPTKVTVTKPGAPAPLWAGNVGSAIQSRLVRVSDGLYVTTMGGDLVAFDPAAGAEKWRVKTGGPLFSTPHVDGNMVYFGSDDHHVYAVDANTREVKWKTPTGGAVFGGPAVAQGVVCIASVDTKIYGLDAKTGEVRWTVKGENMFQSKAATDGTRFYVGGWDNTIRCIDAITGNQVWAEKRGKNPKGVIAFAHSPAISSPTVGDGKVFVTTNDGVLHALSTETGKTIWEFDNKRLGYSGPLFHDSKVYIAIGDQGQTFCLNATNGEKLWETSVGSVIYDSSFAQSSGQVFIGCVSGTFNALDAETGKINWQYHLGPGHLLASPATDDDRVYIGNMSGKVVALPAKVDPLGGATTQPAASIAP